MTMNFRVALISEAKVEVRCMVSSEVLPKIL